jgi:hypothetical protein
LNLPSVIEIEKRAFDNSLITKLNVPNCIKVDENAFNKKGIVQICCKETNEIKNCVKVDKVIDERF